MRTEDDSLRVVILAQTDGQRILRQEPTTHSPAIESAEVFATQWTGQRILNSSRASLAGALAQFDFS
jgi:subfamily B ATP-binding cassette protein HlyB/CyaB